MPCTTDNRDRRFADDGFHAARIAEGPTERARLHPSWLPAWLACARQREVVISTPLLRTDSTVRCLVRRRAAPGQVTPILPARNDSWISRCRQPRHYWRLLERRGPYPRIPPRPAAHAKHPVSGRIGQPDRLHESDLRSFDLNFETMYCCTTSHHRGHPASATEPSARTDAVTLAIGIGSLGKCIWDNLLAP